MHKQKRNDTLNGKIRIHNSLEIIIKIQKSKVSKLPCGLCLYSTCWSNRYLKTLTLKVKADLTSDA